ncbi:ribonuclease P protein component [Marilutibacter spongiae]|uniref:Ribonuclease P protein component n=1 Tax=Marilutibacter spongiae TaxID=2025720 RepID=A0A7W3TPP8_9GAMM|nr:ribonuclease P protein component [Lysobacter spongiae]MBB1061974.1 ribonuclease P protein component [Lysobacter spongiae]
MTDYRFPRTARVRARNDFDRIFKHGRRVALPVLALHFSLDDPASATASAADAAACPGGARLGLAVSRKVDPRAVGRNRIKRAFRDTFRRIRHCLPAGDYVLVARPGASRQSGEALRAAFLQLLQRAGALPRGDVGGTMRAEAVATPTAPPAPAPRARDDEPPPA